MQVHLYNGCKMVVIIVVCCVATFDYHLKIDAFGF